MPESRAWTQMHLFGLEYLHAEEITAVLDLADEFRPAATDPAARVDTLKGKAVLNLFMEPSTRTATSFAVAAKRCGADVVSFSKAASSTSKGETLIDTAKNIEAMGVDVIVLRHRAAGSPQILAKNTDCSIANAGDGRHEHPTQGLLDILTIRQAKGRIEDLKVAIVGDIANSRVARSNLWGLVKLGAEVTFVGPPTMLPKSFEKWGARVAYDFDSVVGEFDVINMLRIQLERHADAAMPSLREYSRGYALTEERLARTKSGCIVMHPGPINRGVELPSSVADGPASVILPQVSNGVAVRMAVLTLLSQARDRASR
ncbi:MAG: aspartate carbamoyltransferase catalytic subunit [Planctomycetes bacterium]|nr:aspartate carbamoyltransferase catalytic subunit [Planctomycetota bacterium]